MALTALQKNTAARLSGPGAYKHGAFSIVTKEEMTTCLRVWYTPVVDIYAVWTAGTALHMQQKKLMDVRVAATPFPSVSRTGYNNLHKYCTAAPVLCGSHWVRASRQSHLQP